MHGRERQRGCRQLEDTVRSNYGSEPYHLCPVFRKKYCSWLPALNFKARKSVTLKQLITESRLCVCRCVSEVPMYEWTWPEARSWQLGFSEEMEGLIKKGA